MRPLSNGRVRSARRTSLHRLVPALVALLIVASCAENPVTGERELGLVGTGQEVAIGAQQYAPTQQMQGGPYTLDPELQDYVSRVGQRLAAVSDRDLPYEFVVLNSSVPNAWALPGGKIAINRGLLSELDSEAELAAVLGHEIIHAAARHGAQAMERGMLTQGALVAASIGLSASGSEYADYALGAAQVGAQLVTQKYGRDAEREADRYGMIYMDRAGYDPAAAVDLQETFVRLSEGRAQNWLQGLFASHPPSRERVENNRAFAAELGSDGEIGRDRYRQATAALRARQPGYEAAAEGREALAARNWDRALAKGREALQVEPAEARFHALVGDAHIGAGRHRQALEAYDRAVEQDDGYYAHWQSRGLANLALDRQDAARRDLEQATRLLPTAQSMNALGMDRPRRRPGGQRPGPLRPRQAARPKPGVAPARPWRDWICRGNPSAIFRCAGVSTNEEA
ncbi:MAG: M48 family metalloprotease [Gammaproteobacteria bacterium]|nr:M48 family metalloprotease [Gammaproteobacteria bacterium]